jgi:hypothetical protein
MQVMGIFEGEGVVRNALDDCMQKLRAAGVIR